MNSVENNLIEKSTIWKNARLLKFFANFNKIVEEFTIQSNARLAP